MSTISAADLSLYSGCVVDGDAAAVVDDAAAAVGEQGDVDAGRSSRPSPRRRSCRRPRRRGGAGPVGPVDPMYIPGRLRTGSRPFENRDVLGAVRRGFGCATTRPLQAWLRAPIGRRTAGQRQDRSVAIRGHQRDATAAGQRPELRWRSLPDGVAVGLGRRDPRPRCDHRRRPTTASQPRAGRRRSRYRSWVAQAGLVDPTTRRPSRRATTGRAWAATVGADDAPPSSANTAPSAPARARPSAAARRSSDSPIGRGSPSGSVAGSGRRCSRRHRPRRRRRAATAIGLRRPAGSAPGGREQRLAGRQVREQRVAAVGVELGEHVVEQQHRRRADARRRPRGAPRAAARAPATAARPATRACAPAARRCARPSSSRCGPTSASRRAAGRRVAAAGERGRQPVAAPRRARSVDRRRRRRRAGDLVVGLARATGSRRSTSVGAGRRPAPRRPRPAWRPTRRACARPRASSRPTGLLQQRVALAQDPVEVGAQRVVCGVQRHERVVEVRRRSPGPPFTSARSSGANTVTRSAPSRSRGRCSGWRLTCTRLRPAGGDLGLDQQRRGPRARPRPARPPVARPARTSASVGAPRNDDERGEVADRLEQVRLALRRWRRGRR